MSYAYRKGSSIFVGYRDDRGRPVRAKCAATTITEGRRLALELEQLNEKIRKGLEAPPPAPTLFKALTKPYLEEVASLRKDVTNPASRIRNHLVPEFGKQLLTEIHTGDVEGFLARKSKSLKPATVRHLWHARNQGTDHDDHDRSRADC